MSKYVEQLRKFSECEKLVYSQKNWIKAIEHMENLERQLAEAREEVKKAFWSGFELSKMNPDDMDIHKHWRHYNKLKEKG